MVVLYVFPTQGQAAAAIVAVHAALLVAVPSGQVQVAVVIVVAPGHLPGFLDQGRGPGQAQVAIVVSKDLVVAIHFPRCQVQPAVVIVVAPGQAPDISRGVSGQGWASHQAAAGAAVKVNGIAFRDGQVQQAIAVVVAPGHDASVPNGLSQGKVPILRVAEDVGVARVVLKGQVEVAIAVVVAPGHADMHRRIGRGPGGDHGAGVVAVDAVPAAAVGQHQVEIAVVIVVTPGHAGVRIVIRCGPGQGEGGGNLCRWGSLAAGKALCQAREMVAGPCTGCLWQ